MTNPIGVSLLVVLTFIADAAAQARPKSFEEVGKVEVRFEPDKAVPGEVVKLIITVTPTNELFWTYPTKQTNQDAKSYVNLIRLPNDGPVLFLGDWVDPPGAMEKEDTDENGKKFKKKIYWSAATWERDALILPDTPVGDLSVKLREKQIEESNGKITTLDLNSRFQCCDEEGCIPSRATFQATLKVLPGSKPIDPKIKDEVDRLLAKRIAAQPKDNTEPKKEVPPPSREIPKDHPRSAPLTTTEDRDHGEDLKQIRSELPAKPPVPEGGSGSGLIGLLATAAFWGLISLVTPCVFPMIPITVSLFLKRGGHSTAKTIKLASIYSLTIIVVLGISALTLLSVFRALSVDPFMNMGLGVLFIFFALSLFGMYDIALPGFLTRWSSSHEGGGVVGTIFMAITFSIVSFTCVAPFLGGFSGMAASGNFAYWELALAALAFSTAFAAPFFLLAMFPKLLKKLPKSGSWMNSVKVVMGFLEMAAALKFFRTAELRLLPMPTYFTYDLVLGMWVVLGLMCGLYLLNVFRLPHDEPQEHIGPIRMLLGFFFLTLAVYLAPGLFRQGEKGERQRPAGSLYAWVDAFLLPEPGPGDLPWSTDLKGAIDKAREEQKKTGKRQFIFVDFTGETCTNCKYNEYSVFPLPNVKGLFQDYHLVQMYTDTVPAHFYAVPPSEAARSVEAGQNLDFQHDVFGNDQLPLYVVLEPRETTIEIVGVYGEGKINHVDRFTAFLRRSLNNPR